MQRLHNPSDPFSALDAPLLCLGAVLREYDAQTYHHCDRVGALAHEFGLACGLGDDELRQLETVARFHDVGKIGVPGRILHKPAALDADEWDAMAAHAVRGERIFAATCLPDAVVIAQSIRHHHEAFDGSGYPDGLDGERIPLLARMVTLVDSYDAMASHRPYQAPLRHDEIMLRLDAGHGRQFDPRLLKAFAAMIDRHPLRVA